MDYEIMMNGNVKIGQYAPDFEAETTMGKVKISDYRGKWLVLFSHPGDFTPVCTTELIAFAKSNPYFQNLNTNLLRPKRRLNPITLSLAKRHLLHDRHNNTIPNNLRQKRGNSKKIRNDSNRYKQY